MQECVLLSCHEIGLHININKIQDDTENVVISPIDSTFNFINFRTLQTVSKLHTTNCFIISLHHCFITSLN